MPCTNDVWRENEKRERERERERERKGGGDLNVVYLGSVVLEGKSDFNLRLEVGNNLVEGWFYAKKETVFIRAENTEN